MPVRASWIAVAGLLLGSVASSPGAAQAQDYDQPSQPVNPDPPAAAGDAPAVGKIWTSTAEPASEDNAARLRDELAAMGGTAPAVMLGGVLVNREGRTLYVFDADKRGASTCYRMCETLWPPFLAGIDDEPRDGFTITERIDGGRQWVHRNRPLYLWTHDSKPGDVTGDKVNGVWHAVRE
ncbi:COG4315 family predicted lipoprotein [Chiayiivirga flava]|uniref:Putative lipoprotein with Yx(FWY)xxD motif n=1 Tax=Chiayiivirga flava TaxID=659595 RepID=A0A7W8D552_9GAMM|nr:hypothetical protein [Chiayiivirga flava]MBB5208109.1 putative lipoprotein with Yx(FWY)xxD motif [Chiayiivirga flava]